MKAVAQERAFFWRDPVLENTELLRAHYITHTFAPHTHDEYAVGVVVGGAEQFHYRRSHHVAPAGQLVFVNPGEVHTGESVTPEGWQYRMFYPPPALMERILSELTGKAGVLPFFPHAVVNDPETVALLTQVHQALEQEPSPLARESWFWQGFSHLITRHSDHPIPPRPLRAEPIAIAQIRLYLEENYAIPITLDDLATHVHFSPFHLLRVFRQATGLPPHAFLTGVRVRRAKSLLALGIPPVDVAQRVGFADQSHLYRHFKCIMGVTPGHYAQQRNFVQDPKG
jgi:AraC-like DNA-binding protein